MNMENSKHLSGKQIKYNGDGLHAVELLSLAIDNPELFDIVEKIIDHMEEGNAIDIERVNRIIKRII